MQNAHGLTITSNHYVLGNKLLTQIMIHKANNRI